MNTPFARSHLPLSHHGRARAVHSVIVDVRRDRYQIEPGVPAHSVYDTVVDHLAALFRSRGEAGARTRDRTPGGDAARGPLYRSASSSDTAAFPLP